MFAYCKNNPVNKKDDTGYVATDNMPNGGDIGAGGGGAAELWSLYKLAQFAHNKVQEVTAKAGDKIVSAAKKVPEALLKGASDTKVYLGIKDGAVRYVGIAKDIAKRQLQHGERFDILQEITINPLTRRQARAIEQVLIENNPSFTNLINSIGKYRSWYGDAVDWGTKWLEENGVKIMY